MIMKLIVICGIIGMIIFKYCWKRERKRHAKQLSRIKSYIQLSTVIVEKSLVNRNWHIGKLSIYLTNGSIPISFRIDRYYHYKVYLGKNCYRFVFQNNKLIYTDYPKNVGSYVRILDIGAKNNN